MLVSVVIPVFNAERYVAACLESVLAQTYPDVEVIAVDDGSRDASRAVLSRYEPRVRVFEQHNAGASVARNRAVRDAKGEVIAFLDADDLWDPDKLAKMMRVMRDHPLCVAAYHGVRLIRADGQIAKASDAEHQYWVSGNALPGLIIGRTSNCFSPSQTLVRRVAFEDAGGFPPHIRQAEDYALWLKLAVRGPILYVVDTLGSYRRHEQSISIEPGNEFGRAYGRLHALLGIRKDIAVIGDDQLRRLFHEELLYAARTLGWFCRQNGDAAGAATAYGLAAELAPGNLQLRGLAVMMRLRALANARRTAAIVK